MDELKYKIGDVVYLVHDYKVVKSIVDSIAINLTKDGKVVMYNIYPYASVATKKVRAWNEAYLVESLEKAKQSALANWKTITQDVEKQLNNLTDEMFEPRKDEQNS